MKKEAESVKTEKGVEAAEVYVRLEPRQSLENKRDLLEGIATTLSALISAERFKAGRRQETQLRLRIKRNVRDMLREIKKLIDLLPKVILPKERPQKKVIVRGVPVRPVKIKPVVPAVPPTKTALLRKELEEIKAKIAKLE